MSKASKKQRARRWSFVIKTSSEGASGRGTVQKKLVIGPDGRIVGIQTIDARSKSFGDDLAKVFAKNVARHRRANVRVAGTKD